LKIHYESFGAGPPLVLVPGWGSGTRRWLDTGWIEVLQAKHLVISVEPRGVGKSDKPHDASAYSYSVMSRDVLALLKHLGIQKVDYLGYSMGAFMGAYLLGHHADKFSSMVLGGIGDETDESKNERFVIARALRAPRGARVDPLGAGYRAYAESDPDNDLEALAVSALQMWPEGYPLELGGDGLRRASIPVLIVNGANDPYTGSAGALARIIPGARLVTVPGTDHLGTWSDPRFKQEVLEFLDRRRK
jgi:pimeloyl-ACP methyl ester carboxylesterase